MVFSCKKDNNTYNNLIVNKNILQPLEVGYSWTFENSNFSTDGQLLGKDTSILGISGKSIISYEGENIEVFYWNWKTYPSYEFSEVKWLCNNINNELFYYGGVFDDSLFVFEKSLSAKLPATINESWTKNIFYFSGGTFFNAGTSDVVCKSDNEIFETGIGNLECFRFDEMNILGDDRIIYETFYYKNIGYVGMNIKIDGILNRTMKLISYNLTPYKSKTTKTIYQSTHKTEETVDKFNIKSKNKVLF